MTRHVVCAIAAFVGACGCSGGAKSKPTPPVPERLVVIFADVTSSLTGEQVDSVQTDVRRIIEALPPNSVVHVFAIGRETETGTEIETDRTPPIESTVADKQLARWRIAFADRVAEELRRLQKRRRETEPDVLSSCITPALRRTATVAGRSSRSEGRVDLFVVSDLIEECGTSLLGGKVNLWKRDIRSEIRLASDFKGKLPDLSRATVTLVLPQHTVNTAEQSKQPSTADLEEFWTKLLGNCGVTKLYFGADLPPADELFVPTADVSAAITVR
jgi:hypothetical protein